MEKNNGGEKVTTSILYLFLETIRKVENVNEENQKKKKKTKKTVIRPARLYPSLYQILKRPEKE